MVTYVKDSFTDQCNNSMIGGIVFDENFSKDPFKANSIAYKIRLANTKRRFTVFGQGKIL